MWLLLVYVAIALGASFLCSILEAVLLSVSPSFVAAEAKRGTKTGKTLRSLKDDIDRPLAAILSLNTVAHTAGAAGAGAQAHQVFGSASVAVVSGVLTFLILVVSEIIPKTLGAVYWRGLSAFTARVLPPLIALMYPLVLLSKAFARILSRRKPGPTLSREEFSALADLVAKEGIFREGESYVLTNLFRFGSLTARDIMTPRTVVAGFDESTTIGEVAREEDKLRFSRLPVFHESLDRVTGYVLKHDIMLALARGEEDTPLEELKREIPTIREHVRVTDLFEHMVKSKEHLVLLVDQFGGTAGVVTLEDVVETLLGMEIVDEIDVVADMQALARQQWRARARRRGLPVQPPDDEAAPRTPASADADE